MNQDRRTAYTQRVIKEALFELIENKPVEEITIKELCAKADINRATFYRHYTDIYDLYTQMAKEISEPSIEHNKDPQSFIDNLPNQLQLLKEHQAFYQSIMARGISTQIAQSNIVQNRQDYVKQRAKAGEDPLLAAITFDFVQYGVTGIILDWVKNGCELPIDQMVAIVANIIKRVYG